MIANAQLTRLDTTGAQIPARPAADSRSLYRTAGAAALAAVLIILLDTAISMAGEDFNPAALSAAEWFALYQADTLSGLRALGLLNVFSLAISIPLYLALFSAHRNHFPGASALGLALFLMGAAIYIANNASVPMGVLAAKYAAAGLESQRLAYAAAGEAVLVRGADFTPGSFTGFIFTEIAGLIFTSLMLRGGLFGKRTAVLGLLGFSLLAVFTVLTTFFPATFDLAMILALIGGLSSAAWYILTARRFFQLSR